MISRNVTPRGFNLNTGTTYLPEIEGYQRQPSDGSNAGGGRMRLDEGYTLDSMGQVLEGVEAHRGSVTSQDSLCSPATSSLMLWSGTAIVIQATGAIMERQSDGARFLAPTYDHGSALGAGLTAENRRDRDPVVFARRGRANPFSPRKQLLVGLARDAVRRSGADLWVARVAALDAVSIRATLIAPPGRLSEVAATFMEHVVLENQRRLCHGDVVES